MATAFFIVLDKDSALPKWLPHTHIWFDYSEYRLEGAVGAIKARVQERGGQNLAMTPLKRAEMLRAEKQFQIDKSNMNSEQGVTKALHSLSVLFQEIQRHRTAITTKGLADVHCGVDSRERQITHMCMLSTGTVSLSIVWNSPVRKRFEGCSAYCP